MWVGKNKIHKACREPRGWDQAPPGHGGVEGLAGQPGWPRGLEVWLG